MLWTEAEEDLLRRMRQAHPDASWKHVAQQYNTLVPEHRQRSHWSLTWKHRDLAALATSSERCEQDDNTDNDDSTPSRTPMTHRELYPSTVTTPNVALPIPSLDSFDASIDSTSALRKQQQMAQQIQQQNLGTVKSSCNIPSPVSQGYNSVNSDGTLSTSLARILPQPNPYAPSTPPNSSNFTGLGNYQSSAVDFRHNIEVRRQSAVMSQATQHLPYPHTGSITEHGPGWREISYSPGYLEGSWQDLDVAGPFMGYPPAA